MAVDHFCKVENVMRVIKAHTKPIETIAFALEGSTVASVARDRSIKVWDMSTGKELWKVMTQSWIGSTAVSRNGQLLASAETNEGVQIRNIATGEPVAFLHVEGAHLRYGGVSVIAFSPDNAQMITASSRDSGMCLLWWKTSDWTQCGLWEDRDYGGAHRHAAFTMDGRMIATMDYAKVEVWDIASRKCLWSTEVSVRHWVTTLAFSPDCRILAFAAGPALRIVDLATFKEVATLEPSTKHIQCAAFSPNGRVLATISNDQNVRLWDTDEWKQTSVYVWKIGQLKCVAFSPDGCVAATAGDKGKIVIWDID